MTLELKVGDKVIYPNHGLAVIENINERSMGEQNVCFYNLRIASNNSLIMIPIQAVQSVGLRKIISDKEVRKLFHPSGKRLRPKPIPDKNERAQGLWSLLKKPESVFEKSNFL